MKTILISVLVDWLPAVINHVHNINKRSEEIVPEIYASFQASVVSSCRKTRRALEALIL